MEEEKKKRGRPKKQQIDLPEELKSLIDEVREKQKLLEEQAQEIQDELSEVKHKEGEWDIKIGDPIQYFDKRLSYELTGYRPINETQGLDFDPDWFTEARDNYIKTGHYCSYMFGSKAYRDFWNEEYKKCREGLTVNGYTIPGTYYYFLNYYQLPNTHVTKLGTSRNDIFPEFYSAQYEFFHYLELCKVLKKDCGLMKSRGVGFSEINAAICDLIYNCYPNSVCMISAFALNYLDKSLDKVWGGINFANDHTDGGFFKLRQVLDKANVKKSSYYKIVNGQKIETGWMSMIEGIVADKDSKIRGDRVDLLVFEEAGSNPNLRKSYIKGNALVEIGGNRFGMRIVGGTGGDRGEALEGLSDIYYNPEAYNVLPFLHNYTDDGDWVLTCYFIPSFIAFYREGYVDHRGVCDSQKARKYYEDERAKLESTPKALIDYRAEYCFTAEEAFALEGENKFNKVKLVELLANIKFKKDFIPTILEGYMEFVYDGPNRDRSHIKGVRFKPYRGGPVHILQHPLWEETNLKEPGETEEDYRNRTDTEGDISYKTPIKNLYVAGIDGIDIGQEQTSDATKNPSKFCTMIRRRIHGMKEPMYVAYYIDRPLNEEEAFSLSIALMYYYNAIGNIEASRLGILGWAKRNNWMHLFMRRPRICYGDPNKKRSFSTPYGTTTAPAMIDHGLDLVAQYVEDYCLNIWFPEFIDLLIKYTYENKGKFDMVAAAQMAEIANEELSEVAPIAKAEEVNTFQDIGYYKDERGYTRFGVIPKTANHEAKFSWERPYEGYNITTNPYFR